MGKLKDYLLKHQEKFDSGIPLEYSRDNFNWFDAKERPDFGDGKWYRVKVEEHQSNDPIIPPDGVA